MMDILVVVLLAALVQLVAFQLYLSLSWAKYGREAVTAAWVYRLEETNGPGYFICSPLPRAGWRIVAVLNKPGSLDLIVVWGKPS